VNIEIPDDIMRATYPTPTELRVEIAVMPFEEEKLTPGRAWYAGGTRQAGSF